MTWRIYRLPGSRGIWHVDSGEGTQIFNVHGYKAHADTESVDGDATKQPRAWIEVFVDELHIVNGIAEFVGPICGRPIILGETSCSKTENR